MKFFTASDVIDVVLPWYQIAKIFGILPFRIIHKNVKLSFLGIITSLLFYSYYVYYIIIYYPFVINAQLMNQLISVADYLLHQLFFLGIYLNNVFCAKKNFGVIKKISEIDTEFKSINVSFPHGKIKKKLIINLIASFVILFGEHLLNWGLLGFSNDNVGNIFVIGDFITDVHRLFILLKTDAILKILRERFGTVNREIKDSVNKNLNVGNKIEKLRFIHYELCDVCEILNDVEWLTVTCFLATLFFTTLSIGFYVYSVTYFHERGTVAFVISVILICLRNIIFGVLLLPGFVNLAKEANRTGIILHKTIVKINDSETQYQLMIFSNQLLHRRVEFTAKGFFQINYAFIFSIFGTITAYLVILIQFQNLTPRDPSNAAGFDLT